MGLYEKWQGGDINRKNNVILNLGTQKSQPNIVHLRLETLFEKQLSGVVVQGGYICGGVEGFNGVSRPVFQRL